MEAFRMKALVVYDSYFGNTEKIALAVRKALQSTITVDLVKIDQAHQSMLAGIDLFIIASPTRAFSPTPAIKSFLKNIPANGLNGIKVAAFDTRISMGDNVPGFLRTMAKLFGYADKPMHDLLLKKGGQATVPSQGFFVKDSEGPLQDGELERAEAWAKEVAAS
jgi:flavodoxin I